MKMPQITLTKTHYIILGILLLAFFAWRLYGALAPAALPERTAPVVRTVTVAASGSAGSASYAGEVRGQYETNLAFQVAGKIATRNVKLGDQVRAGQVLMTLDPQDITQQLTAAQAQHASAQANFKLAADNLRRFEALLQQGAVSQLTYDQYKTQYDAAAATLEQAQAQLTVAQNQLGYTQLVSDHDGSISALMGEVGTVVAAGTPVASLVQDAGREVQIYIPENRLGEVHVGQAATVTFWALQETQSQGTVTEIASVADSTTRTYRVRVGVEHFPEAARLGMTARVTLQHASQGEIVIPTSAIYQTGDQQHVWVVQDGKVRLTSVQTGAYAGSDVVVLRGISAGDVIVTGGVNKLSDGETVQLEGDAK